MPDTIDRINTTRADINAILSHYVELIGMVNECHRLLNLAGIDHTTRGTLPERIQSLITRDQYNARVAAKALAKVQEMEREAND